jgi:predicted nucleotidyltransferase component of viral defense system
MNPAIISMLGRYRCVTVQDYENALKEIIQETALLGLWRSKFFEHAAFYGGTALRILYGLDRFSEDLDFSLLKAQSNFSLRPYLAAIEAELVGMGFHVTVSERDKKVTTAIETALIKAATKEHFIRITVPDALSETIQKNKLMSVKFEVDTNPPEGFETEAKTILQPIPFSVSVYKMPDMFAGKIHAVLHRNWQKRVKGRDYYDFVWYVARGVPTHLSHLEKRLRQSGEWTKKRPMQYADMLGLLEERFERLDVEAAKKEVTPFLPDPTSVDLWSREFFKSLLPRVLFEN